MIENSIVYRDFKGKYEYLPLSKSAGAEIWDKEGKRYIDFTSGWNVTNLGWNNREITDALIAQANKNVQGLLRVGFKLIMKHYLKYTRDLYRCYEIFLEYYPEKEPKMREVLDLAFNLTADKKKMKEIVDNFGVWLLAEIPDHFEVKEDK